ncbi:MAG: glycine cleavage system protein H, partial [Candidatus Lokiarchaeota archaeon]|nr:glycine cleavage system protein H [Candidatus Lokiarchaeota archaeon]MBD3339600.1 glycine cleavage system protein H [Candidatus Lokiarchaeota archaeon]
MEFNIPKNLKYSKTHEYVRVEENEAVIGISDFAQKQLGDIVYVEFPEIGQEFTRGDEMAEIESVKAIGELYAPISCKV